MTLSLFNYYRNLIFTLIFIFAGSTSLLSAGTLHVSVQDKSGIPKKYLHIDINPGGIVAYTNKMGSFTYKLKDGKYTIRINEFNRYMRFDIRVKGVTNKVFTLKW